MINGSLINEGRKYCRMLPLEHSAILLIYIKRYLVLKTNFLSFLRVAVLHRFYCIVFLFELYLRRYLLKNCVACSVVVVLFSLLFSWLELMLTIVMPVSPAL